MKISIAMTTYNGEKYIIEQLNSILNQTRKADEVIICDDCSNDNTVKLISDFIRKNRLDNWSIKQNNNNKGWKKNFLDTINLTSGDIIFCSDQDDIWIKDKIENMVKIMLENEKIHCLAGKFNTIDEHGNEIDFNHLNKEIHGKESVVKKIFDESINEYDVYGCTICFTKYIKQLISEINCDDIPHDAQIWQLATINEGAYFYNQVVIKYRIHQSNSGGVSINNNIGKSNLNIREKEVLSYKKWLLKIKEFINDTDLNDRKYKLNIIEKSIKMNEIREKFLKTKNIKYFIKNIRYIKLYHSKSNFLGDFCYVYNINKIGSKILWRLKKIRNI